MLCQLDEVYFEFFIGSCSKDNGNPKITVQNTGKVPVLASFRLSIEYRMN
jgi:hypothetical protein